MNITTNTNKKTAALSTLFLILISGTGYFVFNKYTDKSLSKNDLDHSQPKATRSEPISQRMQPNLNDRGTIIQDVDTTKVIVKNENIDTDSDEPLVVEYTDDDLLAFTTSLGNENQSSLLGYEDESFQSIHDHFLDLINSGAYSTSQLLDFIESAPGYTKTALAAAARNSDLDKDEFRDATIERLKHTTGIPSGNLINTLGNLGVFTQEDRNVVAEILPSLTAPEDVSIALMAFVPVMASSDDKNSTTAIMKQYSNHDEPEVRVSAILNLAAWGDIERTKYMDVAVMDPDDSVKGAVFLAATNSGIRTDAIKQESLKAIQDESVDIQTRANAAGGLQGYDLNDTEYNLLVEFYSYLNGKK